MSAALYDQFGPIIPGEVLIRNDPYEELREYTPIMQTVGEYSARLGRAMLSGAAIGIGASALLVALEVGQGKQAQEDDLQRQASPPSLVCDSNAKVDYWTLSEDFSWVDYRAAESRQILTYQDEKQLIESMRASSGVGQGFSLVTDLFASRNIVLQRNAFDKTGQSFSGEPILSERRLEVMLDALNTIPASLYEASGLQGIGIGEHLSYPASQEQLIREQQREDVLKWSKDGRNAALGMYYPGEGVALFDMKIFDDYETAVKVVWHEIVGHGVLPRLCTPEKDATLEGLNSELLPGFTYVPYLQQTQDQISFFDSGVLFSDFNGASNAREDIAEAIESVFNIVTPPVAGDGSVVSEKQNLVLSRLKAIEPQIETIIRAIHYRLKLGEMAFDADWS